MENQKSIDVIKNYGIDWEKEKLDRTDTDWKDGELTNLGATIPECMVKEASGLVTASYAWPNPVNGVYPRVVATMNHCWIFFQRTFAKYFPTGQRQNLGDEKMDCVTRGFNNEIEKKLNYAYQTGKFHQPFIDFLNKYDFFDDEGKIRLSNRIPAKLSGTTKYGNSFKAVINTITNIGIFPQSILPEDKSMTWNEYYDVSKITEEVKAIGKESLKYLTINYTIVDDPKEYTKYSDGFKWEAFDNYIDPVDGDYIKRLAENYDINSYGYKIIINEVKKNDMQVSENLLIKLYRLIFHRPLDAGATAHIGVEIDDLLSTLEKSGEWKFIDGVVKFIKLLKAPLQVFGKIFGKHNN